MQSSGDAAFDAGRLERYWLASYRRAMTERFDFLLFDIGGVIGDFDRVALASAAKDARIDPRPSLEFWRSGYDAGEDGDHPMHRAERGELSNAELLQFAETFAPGASVLFDRASPCHLIRFTIPSSGWADVGLGARKAGLRIGALTNTLDGFAEADVLALNPAMHAHVRGLFGEDVLESHVIKCRKPSRAAFTAALAHFGVEPSRVLFVDDEAGNCKGAEAVGMTAVYCVDASAQQVVRQLLSL